MNGQQHSSDTAGRGRLARLLIVLLSALLLTAAVFWQIRRAQLTSFQSHFQTDAAQLAALIDQQADKSLLAIYSLAWFIHAAAEVDATSFQAFAAACLPEHNELQALSWNPRVPPAERAAFEQNARRQGLPHLRITAPSPDGLSAAPAPAASYPVLYIAPLIGNESAVGFDVGSDPVRRAALEQARDTGKPVATEPIRLVQQRDAQPAFLIFAPVFQRGLPKATVQQRRAALRGFAVGVYRPQTLVTAALRPVQPLGLSSVLLDRSAPPEHQFLYRWHDSLQDGSSWKRFLFPAAPRATHTFPFAGRLWALDTLASPTYMERFCPVSYWLVWPAGLLLGLLTARYLETMFASREQLAQLVAERTAQLCQAQEMLRLVLDAIPVRVHWKDRNSVYLGCNRRFAQDAELDFPDQVVGKTDLDLPWKDYAELYRSRDRKVIESGEPMLDYEQPRSTSDGRTLTLCQSKLPLRDAHGAIIGVLSAYEDITERKRAQEALRASEARLRFALEGANDGLWDVDLRTGRLYLSPRGCEILGYGCEEFAANVEQWRQLVHPEDLPPTLTALQAHLDGATPLFAVEQRLRTKSGHWKWILTRGKVAEFAPDGQPIRMTGTHSDITARKEAETALRESEARYRAVVEYSPDGMGVAVEDKMVYVNPAAVRLAGARTAADLLGRSVFEFVPQADRAAVATRRAQMLETGLPSPVVEGKLQRPDGRVIDAEWIGVPILYAGKPAILNSFRDVTEHRRRQRALQASEARYRQLHESMMDAFVAIDFDGRLTDCNESFRKMLGYERHEIQSLTYKDFTPEKWHALDAQIRQSQVRTRGYSDIYEKEYRRKDGSVFPVELRVILLRDDAGSPCGAWAIVRDITERKQTEVALRQSREQLRERAEELETIMGSAPVALWVAHDPQCNFISGNRMANSFDLSRPQPNWSANVSSAYRWFRDGHQLQPEELPMQQAARENIEIHNTEMDLLLPTGRRLSLLGSAVPLRDAHGRARGCVGAFLDNTERKHAVEALRRAHDELEQRVRQRTAELLHANQRLQDLDRLKSQFLATMSHELRTPLNSIIGFTGILRQGFAGPVNDEQKKQLGMVFGSAKHLLSLINDLLDLSRIEAGKIEIEREPFNFVDVVDEVIQNLSPLAGQKQLNLTADLPGPVIPMLGDRKRSYQVLLNLANNAVKFTDRGEVKISAHADGDALRVSVADTGIGIKPEQMGMLFEAFRQLDGSAKRVYEGTGLGLHLCRRLLTLMGGHVAVESQFGKGSRFTFTLPRRLGPSPASQETPHENLKRG